MENELQDLAQIAYEVYAESLNWQNLVQWADVSQQVKQAWASAIKTVLDLAK